jgi:hypothetical protein
MFHYDELLFNERFVSVFRIPYGEVDEFEADGYDRPVNDTFLQFSRNPMLFFFTTTITSVIT